MSGNVQKNITVLGAGMPLNPRFDQESDVRVLGVIGLTTALKLQERGYKVTIIAECRPGDEKSARYTSPWAVRERLQLFAPSTMQ